MNALFSQKWWSTLTSAVFGLSSSLNPLVGGGGGLVRESVDMKLICCLIILTASSPLSLISVLDLSLLPSSPVRSGVSCYT